jgi:hypothetical protein
MLARSFPAALVCRGYCCGPPLPDKPVRTDPSVDQTHLKPRLQWYSPMTCPRQLHIERFEDRLDIDHGTSDAPPPPRKQSNAQQLSPGYLWNSTTQELIPILPEDHPDYRQNQEIITEAIRRWNQVTSK